MAPGLSFRQLVWAGSGRGAPCRSVGTALSLFLLRGPRCGHVSSAPSGEQVQKGRGPSTGSRARPGGCVEAAAAGGAERTAPASRLHSASSPRQRVPQPRLVIFLPLPRCGETPPAGSLLAPASKMPESKVRLWAELRRAGDTAPGVSRSARGGGVRCGQATAPGGSPSQERAAEAWGAGRELRHPRET